MPRNFPPGQPNWRSDEGRSNRWRDENEGRYSSADQERDDDYRYTREEEEESDSAARAGSFDQGRVQYGRRDTRDQSGSTGRYAGYGDFGQGDYSGGRRSYTGQERYGQSGYGRGGYGQSRSGEYRGGNYGGGYARRAGQDPGEQGTSRQGGYGGNYGEGRYGEGGSRSRWNEPYGEGQQYTSRGDYAGESLSRGMGQHRGKGPKGYQRSDERLKEMICERLREDPDIDASDVTVSVQNSRVTLEGTVDSRHTKNLVEDVAEQLGVNDVQNNLRVQRADQSAGSSMTQDRGTATESGKSKQH